MAVEGAGVGAALGLVEGAALGDVEGRGLGESVGLALGTVLGVIVGRQLCKMTFVSYECVWMCRGKKNRPVVTLLLASQLAPKWATLSERLLGLYSALLWA